MSDLSELPFDYPSAANPAAPRPRPCRHPKAMRQTVDADNESETYACGRCGRAVRVIDSVRGRRNRQRGNAIERDIARALGLKRVGQFGGPDDVSGEMFVAQVKSGGAFPERLWGWLKALPRNAAQTPLLVVTDAPGPGHRRRALVILELSDWAALHAGEVEE